MPPNKHVCRPLLSLVLDCGHWAPQACLDPSCDRKLWPATEPCPGCQQDELDEQLWRDELLDSEVLYAALRRL